MVSAQSSGRDVTLSNCDWSTFNGVYNSPAPDKNFSMESSTTSQTAYLWKDTDTYSIPHWVIGWGFEYNGNKHQMACGANRLSDCVAGEWWYFHNGWNADEDCE